ncbi:MAG: hypothetical protein ACYC63_14910 [Armatimonadota bacterium]
MTDDDLDLELDDEPKTPRPATSVKSSPAPKAAAPAQPAVAKTVGTRPPGLAQRARDYVKHPQFNGRTFLTILIILIILVILAENWAPVRFYLFGIALELPKAIAFLLDVALGAILMWLWLRRPGKVAEGTK